MKYKKWISQAGDSESNAESQGAVETKGKESRGHAATFVLSSCLQTTLLLCFSFQETCEASGTPKAKEQPKRKRRKAEDTLRHSCCPRACRPHSCCVSHSRRLVRPQERRKPRSSRREKEGKRRTRCDVRVVLVLADQNPLLLRFSFQETCEASEAEEDDTEAFTEPDEHTRQMMLQQAAPESQVWLFQAVNVRKR